jgi:outer membrane protein assembly factor BamA
VASGVWESLPDGYEGYEALTYGTELTLDSRKERPHNVSGVHARALVEHGVGVGSARGDQWVRAGGSLGFFADLSGAHHTLSLTTTVGRTVPLRGQTPFFELTDIGGSNAMRGFRTFRLMGESYATAILQYSWPLWIYLDGLAQVAVGNTFSGRFEGFRPGNLRMSFGVGLSAVRSLEHRFDFSVGWGTETFERGAQVVQYTITLGTTREF